jgi:hypothetical protein
MPASRAIQGGHMTDDRDVNAMRTLRNAEESAASAQGSTKTDTIRKIASGRRYRSFTVMT